MVCSRDVAAFSSPPRVSKISAICWAVYVGVPLKGRCSMKCETPARSAFSSREPAPIQKPIATERTCSSRSEMTRSPESSSLRTYFCTGGWYSGAAATLSPSSEGCPAPIPNNDLSAVAFKTTVGLEHRPPTAPRRPAMLGLEGGFVEDRTQATQGDIEPWELH